MIDINDKKDDFNRDLGVKLQEARLRAKIKQQQIADLLNCTRVHISHIENGHADISAYELKVYAENCDINLTNMIMYNGGSSNAEAISEHFDRSQIDTIIDVFTASQNINNKAAHVTNINNNKSDFINRINLIKQQGIKKEV